MSCWFFGPLCSAGWILSDVSQHRICHIFHGYSVLVWSQVFLGMSRRHTGKQGYKISFHSFLTWALEGAVVSTLPWAEEPPLPIKFKARWAPVPVWTCRRRGNKYFPWRFSKPGCPVPAPADLHQLCLLTRQILFFKLNILSFVTHFLPLCVDLSSPWTARVSLLVSPARHTCLHSTCIWMHIKFIT